MVNGLESLMPIPNSMETRQDVMQSSFKWAVAHIWVEIVNEEKFGTGSIKIEDVS